MTATLNEKNLRPSCNSTGGGGTYLGAEATTQATPIPPAYCCTDALGLPKAACWDMAIDQHRRGYLLGYAQGALRVEHDVDASVRRIMAQLREQGWGGDW